MGKGRKLLTFLLLTALATGATFIADFAVDKKTNNYYDTAPANRIIKEFAGASGSNLIDDMHEFLTNNPYYVKTIEATYPEFAKMLFESKMMLSSAQFGIYGSDLCVTTLNYKLMLKDNDHWVPFVNNAKESDEFFSQQLVYSKTDPALYTVISKAVVETLKGKFTAPEGIENINNTDDLVKLMRKDGDGEVSVVNAIDLSANRVQTITENEKTYSTENFAKAIMSDSIHKELTQLSTDDSAEANKKRSELIARLKAIETGKVLQSSFGEYEFVKNTGVSKDKSGKVSTTFSAVIDINGKVYQISAPVVALRHYETDSHVPAEQMAELIDKTKNDAAFVKLADAIKAENGAISQTNEFSVGAAEITESETFNVKLQKDKRGKVPFRAEMKPAANGEMEMTIIFGHENTSITEAQPMSESLIHGTYEKRGATTVLEFGEGTNKTTVAMVGGKMRELESHESVDRNGRVVSTQKYNMATGRTTNSAGRTVKY